MLGKALAVKERLRTSFIDCSPGLHHVRSHRRSNPAGRRTVYLGAVFSREVPETQQLKDCYAKPFAAVHQTNRFYCFSPAFSPLPARGLCPCQARRSPLAYNNSTWIDQDLSTRRRPAHWSRRLRHTPTTNSHLLPRQRRGFTTFFNEPAGAMRT